MLFRSRGFGIIFSFFWSESVRIGQNRSENSPQFRVGGISYFFGRNRSKQVETARNRPKRRAQAFGLQVVQSKVEEAEHQMAALREGSRPVLFQAAYPIPASSFANIHIHTFTKARL